MLDSLLERLALCLQKPVPTMQKMGGGCYDAMELDVMTLEYQ